jgi:hypothetical protein
MYGHSGPLQNSMPGYTHPPLRWQTGLRNDYTYKDNSKNVYVWRNHVPVDANWGRSDVGIWAVDGTKEWQGTLFADKSRAPLCPYLDYPYVAPFNPVAAAPRPVLSGQVYPIATGAQPDVAQLRSLHTSTSAWR